MRRWLPHVHVGGSCDQCVNDDEGGREGWYVQVCWFGFMAGVNFSSVYAERRLMAEFTTEREARGAVAAAAKRAQSAGPTTGESHGQDS